MYNQLIRKLEFTIRNEEATARFATRAPNSALLELVDPAQDPDDNYVFDLYELVHSGYEMDAEEKAVALEWINRDYLASMSAADRHIRQSKELPVNHLHRRNILHHAINYADRAAFDLRLAQFINPEHFLCRDHKALSEQTEELKALIRLTADYPSTAQEILPLHLELKAAEVSEQFDLAGDLLDRIRTIEPRYRSNP